MIIEVLFFFEKKISTNSWFLDFPNSEKIYQISFVFKIDEICLNISKMVEFKTIC